MLVVCEGVDNGGKTTLIDALSRLHPHNDVIVHQGPPPLDVNLVEHYERDLLVRFRSEIRSNRDLVLLDRHHVGELIYGPLYRGEARLSRAGALHVELLLRSLGAVRVLVQPQIVHRVKRRYENLGDNLLKAWHIDEVHAEYEAYGEHHRWIRGSADGDAGTINPDGILKLAEATTWITSFTADISGYVGPHDPTYLLVGDERSNAVPVPWTTAAFTPLREPSSSSWLLNAVLTADLQNDVGVLNANEPGQDLKVAVGLLRGPRVVALGGMASAALTKAEVPHTKIQHPQWARRFKHSDPVWYAERLKEAVERAPDPGLVRR